MQAKFLSIRQAAEKSGLSRARLQQMVLRGEIKGAEKVGSYWVIPGKSVPVRQRQRKNVD